MTVRYYATVGALNYDPNSDLDSVQLPLYSVVLGVVLITLLLITHVLAGLDGGLDQYLRASLDARSCFHSLPGVPVQGHVHRHRPH